MEYVYSKNDVVEKIKDYNENKQPGFYIETKVNLLLLILLITMLL